MFLYLGILLLTIGKINVFSIPISVTISGIIFIVWYLNILERDLYIKKNTIIQNMISSLTFTLPFLMLNFFLSPNYTDLFIYILYFIIFTIVYLFFVLLANVDLTRKIVARIRKFCNK